MEKSLLLVLGANPAWQKTLVFKDFIPGKVNRGVKEENYPSGKGVNFCRAARCSKLADTCIFQFAGGINGQRLCSGLESSGFMHHTINTSAETRNCITCLTPDGKMTEIIGVSYPVSSEESFQMLQKIERTIAELPSNLSATFAITGSLPDGSDPVLYEQAARIASARNIPILLDTLVKIPEILALPGKIVLKVNQEEFLKITGCKDIISAHRFAIKMFPEKIFAITNGKDSATLSVRNEFYEYTLPEINVVSPLGAGDTASAVLSALIAVNTDEADAFKMALAAASANCLTPVAGEFSMAAAMEISARIKVAKTTLQEI